ncbi:hypothetical protein SRHO_G00060770 [Serrasalmus rhombeus]
MKENEPREGERRGTTGRNLLVPASILDAWCMLYPQQHANEAIHGIHGSLILYLFPPFFLFYSPTFTHAPSMERGKNKLCFFSPWRNSFDSIFQRS